MREEKREGKMEPQSDDWAIFSFIVIREF